MRLLLVEDDPEVGGMLTEALRHRGHVVDHVERGADAVWMAAEQRYDVVILDVGLPDLSGLEVCAQLRAQQPVLPVLMLTGHTDVLARVQGLDAGADDYLAKPVSLAELEARLRALARRGERPVVEQYVAGDVVVDTGSRKVQRQGRSVPLVGREYDLVELLARRAGEVVSRRHLMTQLWDRDAEVTANALDVLVASVRRKLEAPFDQPILTTERGRGYRIA
jgi:two-component system OmpR family response regulator